MNETHTRLLKESLRGRINLNIDQSEKTVSKSSKKIGILNSVNTVVLIILIYLVFRTIRFCYNAEWLPSAPPQQVVKLIVLAMGISIFFWIIRKVFAEIESTEVDYKAACLISNRYKDCAQSLQEVLEFLPIEEKQVEEFELAIETATRSRCKTINKIRTEALPVDYLEGDPAADQIDELKKLTTLVLNLCLMRTSEIIPLPGTLKQGQTRQIFKSGVFLAKLMSDPQFDLEWEKNSEQ